VDLVGAFDDFGCEVLVFHFFGTDFTDGADALVLTRARVAVGMPVTRHPPHRSGREEVSRRGVTPALGDNAKAHQWVRMTDTGSGYPRGD